MKKKLINFSLTLTSIVITLIILELAAQFYVYKIAGQGKLFEPSNELGWKVLPSLNLNRKNANGKLWKIVTNEKGLRGKNDWESNKTKEKILILGDSYAFGEGVNLEDRFDNVFERMGYSILNTGVMGFGTDQQYVKSIPLIGQLNKNDIILVLTYYNDFFDILNKSHSGRSKPWYEIREDSLYLNSPKITFIENLRDKSYLFSKVNSILSKNKNNSNPDINLSCNIYEKIIQSLRSNQNKTILAFHGIQLFKDSDRKIVETRLMEICKSQKLTCINLDEHFNLIDHPEYFLKDGHWNKLGNNIVGEILIKEILKVSKDAILNY